MTTLEAPRVDEDTTTLDATMFDDIIPCVRCQGRAVLAVVHKCCNHVAFGCVPCEQLWEAHCRMQFMFGEVIGRRQRCGQCKQAQESFDDAFHVEPI